ncbi:MAG: hypothetical protein ABJD66_04295 [Cellulophaga sp.]|uniref:hypothetical protein n=1 Tax=Cellulophaga sp. TaxID=1972202 RepID=UPI003266FBF0
MKGLTTYTTIAEIDSALDIDVHILESRIFTTTDISKIHPSKPKEKNKNYLCISIEIKLEEFESVTDGAVYARPRFLIILGVLTFLTQELFIPFDFFGNSTVVRKLEKSDVEKFEFKKTNHLEDIRLIIAFINSSDENDKRLFYSLIDRHRKALFLEKESEENMIHNDEILLSHFHILELLSTKYYSKQKQLIKQSISQFSEHLLKDIYLLDGNHLQSEQNSKGKLVESVFLSELPVASKIMFMFQEQGILTNRLKTYILDLVKDRNSVAHGRQVYQESVIFPVPPFFPLVRNREYSFEMLRILSARAISLFLGINHLEEEWSDFQEYLHPSFEELNEFISKKRYEKLSADDFYEGIDNDITPYTIVHYLLNKKLKIDRAIPVLSNIILNYREVEEETVQIILAIVLIVDELTDKLKDKCIDIIKISAKKRWLPNFKMRDVLYQLEYLGHKPKILREMISIGDIR